MKRLFWHYCLQLSFFYKIVSQIFLNLFFSGDKKLLSGFLRKWGWFQGHNEKSKFQKTETLFCRWKRTYNNEIKIFLSLENPSTSLLAKGKTWKRIFNTNSELSQNRTEKQIMPSKTTMIWLFIDILCYLFIACFDWKIGICLQTIVRVYYTSLNLFDQKGSLTSFHFLSF